MHFLEPIQAQQIGQLKSVEAIALVGVFGYPGVRLWMRTDYPMDQGSDDRHGPRRQLASLQMHVDLPLQISKSFDQIGCAGPELPLLLDHSAFIQSHLLKITRP